MLESLESEQIIKFLIFFQVITIDSRLKGKLGRHSVTGKPRLDPWLESMSVKVYFPNFIFSLVRSGKRRDPNQAVFRVPSMLTKLDISQYLSKIYNLNVTDVHTVNFIARESKARRRYFPSYKNAIVTYKGPNFSFPPSPDPSLLKYPLQDAGPVKFPKLS